MPGRAAGARAGRSRTSSHGEGAAWQGVSEAEYNVGVAYRDGSVVRRDLDRALASFLAAMHAEPKSVVGMMAACEAASMLLVQAHCTRANLTTHEELSAWWPAASANGTDARSRLEAMDRVLRVPATADAAACDSSQRLATNARYPPGLRTLGPLILGLTRLRVPVAGATARAKGSTLTPPTL